MAQTLPFDFEPPEVEDEELAYAMRWFRAVPNLSALFGQALRGAIDDVLDTYRTGRFDIYAPVWIVGKTEKSFVGTRAEIRLIADLAVPRGKVLDMDLGNGVEVDVKHTLFSSWMIPKEAVGKLCLCLRSNDKKGVFSAYLVRANAELLGGNEGGNGDKKRALSYLRTELVPLFPPDAPLPENLILKMPAAVRTAVFSHAGQEDRFITLFTLYPNKVITRHWILAIGQKADSPRRVRAVRGQVKALGYEMLCGTWVDQREKALAAGHVIGDGDWVSVPIG